MNWQTIGFNKNKFFFEEAIKANFFNHAYLFSGEEMIGKKAFALELASKIVGPHVSDIFMLGELSSENNDSITIENVRELKSFVSLSPRSGTHKFVIIDNAHWMTPEAQNAILKVLEEPSSSTIFILTSSYPEVLLPTILSRCQELKFYPHSRKTITELLAASSLSKTNQDFVADFANGRYGLVKNIIEKNLFGEIEDSVKKVMLLSKSSLNDRLETAQKLTDEKNKAALPKVVFYWMLYLHTRLEEPKAQKMLKNLVSLHEIVNKSQLNHRLALENFLVKI